MVHDNPNIFYGTTIVSVREDNSVVVAGDGQISLGPTVMKSTACKIKRLYEGRVIAGFAGATADAMALLERLEAKLEKHSGQLMRASVEMAKDWRTDKYLRRLEAMMIVADKEVSLLVSGTGDVIEPEGGIVTIGSGGNYALSAAKAFSRMNSGEIYPGSKSTTVAKSSKKPTINSKTIALESLRIASEICVYTNNNVTCEELKW